METLLIIDDEPNYLLVLEELLSDEGYSVITAETAVRGLEIIQTNDLDAIITDMKMPGMDGMSLLEQVSTFNPDLPVIMMTAFGSVANAVEAMKKGAFDYITKPFANEELKLTIKKALEHHQLLRSNKQLHEELQERYQFDNIIGKSAPMQRIYQLIEKVAPTRATVLITGESGTGKELIARAIHYNSQRKQKPFISVNCGALPENLLESELFGHEKGSFSGAVSLRKGRFELAHQGTLFLDEISEMSPSLQVKLLRALQEMTFERVGGTETLKVDVRIVAASNRNLKIEVAEDRFRSDLFYRLNVVHIPLPPLRARRDDIPLLVDHFLRKYTAENATAPHTLERSALAALMDYGWPGNVRELENVIERTVILSSGDSIGLDDLPHEVRSPEAPGGESVPNEPSWMATDPLERDGFPQLEPGERLPDSGMKPRQLKALDFMNSRGFITNKYYSQLNEISERHALRELNEMVELGLINRIGKGRSCRYILTAAEASE